jgi:hypothetical protein
LKLGTLNLYVAGQKRWVFYPPEMTPFMHPQVTNEACAFGFVVVLVLVLQKFVCGISFCPTLVLVPFRAVVVLSNMGNHR